MERTRTRTVATGITESFLSIGSLLVPTEPLLNFVEAMLENTGDTDLKIACGTGDDAHSKTLAAGAQLFLGKANLDQTYVKTVDDTGSNILEFVGTPEG